MITDKIFTRGNRAKTKVKLSDVIKLIAKYIADEPNAEYDITIGTDSQNHKYTRMVEVIAVCRVGDGGIFFYRVEDIPRISELKVKIYEETFRSIQNATGFYDELAYELIDYDIDLDEMHNNGHLGFAIHADIGKRGKTNEIINEICGYIDSMGFESRIKPESYAASGIANMLSK